VIDVVSRLKVAYLGEGKHFKRIKSSFEKKFADAVFFNLKNFFLANDVFDIESIDIYVISSPNGLHYEQIKWIRSFSDKPIFCEKPLFSVNNDVNFLKDEKIYVNHNFRFSSHALEIKKWLKENNSEYFNINIDISYPIFFDSWFEKSWRSDVKMMPTGVYENLLIHYFDFVCYLFGKPEYKSSQTNSIFNSPATFSSIFMSSKNYNCHMRASYLDSAKENIQIQSKTSGISISMDEVSFTEGFFVKDQNNLFRPPKEMRKNLLHQDDGLDASIENFLNLVECSENLIQDFKEKLNITKLFFEKDYKYD